MPIHISKAGAKPEFTATSQPVRRSGNQKINLPPERFEAYGRVNCTPTDIAAAEGLTRAQVNAFLRSRPELKEAYERGRARCKIAIRQKQVQMALAGSERLLIHAGYHFADQEQQPSPQLPDRAENSQSTWDDVSEGYLAKLRSQYLGSEESDSEQDAG